MICSPHLQGGLTERTRRTSEPMITSCGASGVGVALSTQIVSEVAVAARRVAIVTAVDTVRTGKPSLALPRHESLEPAATPRVGHTGMPPSMRSALNAVRRFAATCAE